MRKLFTVTILKVLYHTSGMAVILTPAHSKEALVYSGQPSFYSSIYI
jgi:hypothetical protein